MKASLTATLLASALMTTTQAEAAEPDLSLMGLAVGESLQVPECPFRALNRGHVMYDDPVSICWRHQLISEQNVAGIAPVSGQILVLKPEGPAFLDTTSATVSLENGMVSLVTVKLPAARDQKAAFTWLEAQFGSPTTYEEASIENLYGESVPTIMANWNLPTGQIQLTGATTANGNGVVTIMSHEEAEKLSMPFDAGEDE